MEEKNRERGENFGKRGEQNRSKGCGVRKEVEVGEVL